MSDSFRGNQYKCKDCGHEFRSAFVIGYCPECKQKQLYRKNKTDMMDFIHYTHIYNADSILENGLKKAVTIGEKDIIFAYQNNKQDFNEMIKMVTLRELGDLNDIVSPDIILREKVMVTFKLNDDDYKSAQIDEITRIVHVYKNKIDKSQIKIIKPVQSSPHYFGGTVGDIVKREIAYHRIHDYELENWRDEELISIINDILDIQYTLYLEQPNSWKSQSDFLIECKNWKLQDFKNTYRDMRSIIRDIDEFYELTEQQTLIKLLILKSYDRNLNTPEDFGLGQNINIKKNDIQITKDWLSRNKYMDRFPKRDLNWG